jgi:flavin-binding protein dodecin
MAVAKVIESDRSSPDSFEDAVRVGIGKAARPSGTSGRVGIGPKVNEEGKITANRVTLRITFVLD